MVSASRISPTTMTSGIDGARRAEPVAKSGASTPNLHLLHQTPAHAGVPYSMGSSMVMMPLVAQVDLVDQRRQRVCLARAGRTANQHESALQTCQRSTEAGSPSAARRGTTPAGGGWSRLHGRVRGEVDAKTAAFPAEAIHRRYRRR